ncbi:hypothetical protein FOQG_12282 [Fusarium oxysporum f. sp. raphani 54005]|uniref:Uncharacterized protein n=2 Tax=Fusarium oxysporum f. sp. raphani TaxID=96318 RepID=X0BMK2_FUSOX|nr:hypothetical protein FOQG_12282 [Fusarium oxysporum f. sp. raphani 54005]KAG7434926.1 hypothetical protein Forpi1262_v005426 [Fusarium oxysporum f. sp. raphani]
MAPTAPTASKTKPLPSGQKRRQALRSRLLAEEQKQNANNQQEIARLRDALQKKDEELASLTTQEMIDLDVEMQDDYSADPDDVWPDDANNKKSKSQKKKERKKKNKEAVKSQQEVLFASIEEPDPGENAQDEEGLFKSDSEVESHGPDSDSNSDFDPDSDSAAFSDEDYGKALYTFPGTKPVKGVKTVGWSGGRFTGYINMYGKKSVARYRVERSSFPAQYEDSLPKEEKVSNPVNRHGDELKDNGKFKYTKRHIRGIMAVAWKPVGLGVSRNDLDCINPDLVRDWKRVPTYVLIAWDIDGDGRNIKKTWETRACLRTRWGKKDADIAIYEAAAEAEDRYEEAKTGKRPAKSKSPSVGLAQSHVIKQREKSLGVNLSSPSRSTHAGRASKSPPRDIKNVQELRAEFMDDYLELLGYESFNDLSPSEKADCVVAWRERKSALSA